MKKQRWLSFLISDDMLKALKAVKARRNKSEPNRIPHWTISALIRDAILLLIIEDEDAKDR